MNTQSPLDAELNGPNYPTQEQIYRARIKELETALRIAGHYLTDVYLQSGDEYHGGLGAFRNDIDRLLGSPSRPENLSTGSPLSDRGEHR